MDINSIILESHTTAIEKGWWDEPRAIAEQLMLVVSELAEALEELRDGHPPNVIRYDPNQGNKPEGFPVELADTFIRLADTCGQYGIPLEQALREKMAYNRTRPHKHGRKF